MSGCRALVNTAELALPKAALSFNILVGDIVAGIVVSMIWV
jgi:hypothetical protein